MLEVGRTIFSVVWFMILAYLPIRGEHLSRPVILSTLKETRPFLLRISLLLPSAHATTQGRSLITLFHIYVYYRSGPKLPRLSTLFNIPQVLSYFYTSPLSLLLVSPAVFHIPSHL